MKPSISEQLMYTTVLIKCTYLDGKIGSGTGFIYNFCKNDKSNVPVVITNKHVIENTISIEFEFCLRNDDGTPNDIKTFSININNAKWIYHPKGLDLCCLPLAPIFVELEKKNVKIFYVPLDSSVVPDEQIIKDLHAMEDIIMIGYPIGLIDTFNHKPVIRRGITSSHLKNDYLGKKEFLIDMACFPGSSGSPIFILNEGTYSVGDKVYAGSRVLFIGILWGGPQYDAKGHIIQYSIPNNFSIDTKIPTNLGFAIKSSELIDFENYFQNIISNKI